MACKSPARSFRFLREATTGTSIRFLNEATRPISIRFLREATRPQQRPGPLIGFWSEIHETHAFELRDGSAILEEIAAARRYRSITSRGEAEAAGLTENQIKRASFTNPLLIMPIYGPDGEVVERVIKPNRRPETSGKKGPKYLMSSSAKVALDFTGLASNRARIRSVEPLFVVEGIKKTDSVLGLDVCCLGLLSVWGWRGRNEVGGLTALPDWEDVHLKQREVFITFDSDVQMNPHVFYAARRLKAFLEGRRAKVRVILLPEIG